MSTSRLPERASLDHLKKVAKKRLLQLRQSDPNARLADAQLQIARDYGFTSWRALKAELDRTRSPTLLAFFAACAAGDVPTLARLISDERTLARERNSNGFTALHVAVQHPRAIELLLAHGADPNVRDVTDNALPLHLAAARGPIESVRALLLGGSDATGADDVHRLDAIGWATVFDDARLDVADLLVEHGAHHHVFSAIALGDLALLQRVIEDDADAIARRLSRFEQEQTALHYVVAPPDGLIGGSFRTGDHYRTLELLIELGADLEARDTEGRTPLDVAMLRGDTEATRLLRAAGAVIRETSAGDLASGSSLAQSIAELTPMLRVSDVATIVDWYRGIGFEVVRTHEDDDGRPDWASMRFGDARLMFASGRSSTGTSAVSLWIRTRDIDALYKRLRARQLEHERSVAQGEAGVSAAIPFTEDLHTTFYGEREFCIRDPNGVELCFHQPASAATTVGA